MVLRQLEAAQQALQRQAAEHAQAMAAMEREGASLRAALALSQRALEARTRQAEADASAAQKQSHTAQQRIDVLAQKLDERDRELQAGALAARKVRLLEEEVKVLRQQLVHCQTPL